MHTLCSTHQLIDLDDRHHTASRCEPPPSPWRNQQVIEQCSGRIARRRLRARGCWPPARAWGRASLSPAAGGEVPEYRREALAAPTRAPRCALAHRGWRPRPRCEHRFGALRAPRERAQQRPRRCGQMGDVRRSAPGSGTRMLPNTGAASRASLAWDRGQASAHAKPATPAEHYPQARRAQRLARREQGSRGQAEPGASAGTPPPPAARRLLKKRRCERNTYYRAG